MLIKGEKYACEACVRGHRVSSCTHSERKLLHVNKKGRPVSQCQHCRSLRKARSQHVKCECHDKAHAKEDCPHLKTEAGVEAVTAAAPMSTSPDTQTCCCGHGARCTCSLKKDVTLDTVPEDFPQMLQPKEQIKPRISSLNNHEPKATVFTNGHHKPVHKINDAHNHCGAPYRVPSRSHTITGHREIAQRSTDSLPLLKHAQRPTESPLHTVTSAPRENRKSKSEHNSPELGPVNPILRGLTNELYIPPLSPNAYSYSPFDSQSPTVPPTAPQEQYLPDNIPESWFTTFDEAHAYDTIPASGYNDVPPVDWSTFDFTNNNTNFTAATKGLMPSQPPSYATSTDHIGFPAIPRVNSSSGEVSDADDYSAVHRPSHLTGFSSASQDLSSPGDDSDTYRLSSASSFFGTPQANLLAGNLDNLDIDEYVARTVAEQKRMNSQSGQRPQPQPHQASTRTSPSSMRSSSQIQPSQQHVQLSPQPVQPSPLQFQASPPQSESPQPRNNSTTSYTMSNSRSGSEHAFTVSEAQAFAHMNGKDENAMTKTQTPGVNAFLTEDPMWFGTTDGRSAFRLDDEREDEDWVR